MQRATIIQEINKLSLSNKFFIVEQTLKSIKKEESKNNLTKAAEVLYDDYANDKELTSFTSLDFENFYEAR